jgi:hypothetical protein
MLSNTVPGRIEVESDPDGACPGDPSEIKERVISTATTILM